MQFSRFVFLFCCLFFISSCVSQDISVKAIDFNGEPVRLFDEFYSYDRLSDVLDKISKKDSLMTIPSVRVIKKEEGGEGIPPLYLDSYYIKGYKYKNFTVDVEFVFFNFRLKDVLVYANDKTAQFIGDFQNDFNNRAKDCKYKEYDFINCELFVGSNNRVSFQTIFWGDSGEERVALISYDIQLSNERKKIERYYK